MPGPNIAASVFGTAKVRYGPNKNVSLDSPLLVTRSQTIQHVTLQKLRLDTFLNLDLYMKKESKPPSPHTIHLQ